MALMNKYDIVIQQGATFSLAATWRDSSSSPVDLTGYTARAQVRASYSASSALVSLTSTNGGIVLGGINGTIALTISATSTAALSAPWVGVWDLELQSGGGEVTRLLEGAVTVTPEVTR